MKLEKKTILAVALTTTTMALEKLKSNGMFAHLSDEKEHALADRVLKFSKALAVIYNLNEKYNMTTADLKTVIGYTADIIAHTEETTAAFAQAVRIIPDVIKATVQDCSNGRQDNQSTRCKRRQA